MTGRIIIDHCSIHDLPFEAESLLVCILLIVIVEDAFLSLDFLVIVPHHLIDPLYRPLYARIKVVFDMVIPSPRESCLL